MPPLSNINFGRMRERDFHFLANRMGNRFKVAGRMPDETVNHASTVAMTSISQISFVSLWRASLVILREPDTHVERLLV